jgi:hypothetical protein
MPDAQEAMEKVFVVSHEPLDTDVLDALLKIHGEGTEIVHCPKNPFLFNGLGRYVKNISPFGTCYVIGALAVSLFRTALEAPEALLGLIERRDGAIGIFHAQKGRTTQKYPTDKVV